MTQNGVAAWTDLDNDGVATAVLNSGGGGGTPDDDSVTTAKIADGAILNADINSGAAISVSKLAPGTATYVVTSTAGTAVWAAPAGGAPSGAAGGSLTGTYPNPTIASIPSGATATTQSAADSSTKVATTAFATTADNLKANLASPTFTGTPVLPAGTDLSALTGIVGGLPKIIIRTGDSGTISSSATPLSDDTLLWPVGASDRWFFQAFILFTCANAGGTSTVADLKMAWAVPASGAMQWGVLGGAGNQFGGYGNTPVGSSPNAVSTAAGTVSMGMAGSASEGVALTGFYTGGGTSGNVNFQWSQDVSNAATLLIAKNSMIIAWRIA